MIFEYMEIRYRSTTGPEKATFDGLSSGGAVISANLIFFRVFAEVFAYLLLLTVSVAR